MTIETDAEKRAKAAANASPDFVARLEAGNALLSEVCAQLKPRIRAAKLVNADPPWVLTAGPRQLLNLEFEHRRSRLMSHEGDGVLYFDWPADDPAGRMMSTQPGEPVQLKGTRLEYNPIAKAFEAINERREVSPAAPLVVAFLQDKIGFK